MRTLSSLFCSAFVAFVGWLIVMDTGPQHRLAAATAVLIFVVVFCAALLSDVVRETAPSKEMGS